MTLYNSGDKDTPQYSQLAYRIGYFPFPEIPEQEQRYILWSRSRLMNKARIEQLLNEEKTELYLPGEGTFQVRWAYNNIPTETQWKKWKDGTTFHVSFRISAAIPGSGRVAILSYFRKDESK